MDENDYKELKENLSKEYVLIPKGKLWSLAGGFLGMLVAVGIISFGAAKSVLVSTTTAKTISDIKKMHTQASEYVGKIEDLFNDSKDKIEQLDRYFVKTNNLEEALNKANEEIAQRVKYNSNIEIHNAKLTNLVMDVHWPEGETPSNRTNLQVFTDLSNDAQTWQIREN